ncbi:hypothetical protein [Allorhizocola rhizosphaerae]|uniref:hypothetical protein n=1 Tax=Allorhizocola rhizosphaerae TaxID=1872709 RepID=UPI0013C2E8F1|nr:hypothetical protein [Allorhizocola rhizosphaerae]
MRQVKLFRSWAVATTVALAAVFALGNAAYATDPVEIEAQEFRDKLFVASARLHTPGAQGMKDLALSAELYAYRQLHPNATVQQLNEHVAVVRQYIDSKLTATDMTRQAYELMPRLLNLLALDPRASVSAPVMKELYEMVIAPQGKLYGDRLDQVATAQFSYETFERLYPIQDRVWRYVTAMAQQDPAFAQAWDGNFGARLGVMSTATVDQLAADPVIYTYMNIDAILAAQGNTQTYLREVRAQINGAMGAIQAQNTAMIGLVGQLNSRYPLVVNGPRPTEAIHAQERDAAAERQKIIDGAGTAVDVLGTLLGFAVNDGGRTKRIVTGVGKSAVQIATAINKFIPTIAGMGLGQVLTSMSTVALTGNIIGAIGALLPVFANQPSMDQLMMAEMQRLRQDVANLANNMNGRFDRIENALTTVYGTMISKFDELLALQEVTLARLAGMERSLFNLNTSVNNWGAAIMKALQQGQLNTVKERINWGIGHLDTYGEPIQSYSDYQTVENPLHLFATDTAYHAPFAGPDPESYPTQDPLAVLQTYRAKGAIHYLDWYARQHYSWQATPIAPPADVAPWIVAARSYARLEVENPGYAKLVNPGRAGGILGAGQGILDSTTQFSKPLAAPDANGNRTNALFTNLLNDYRGAAQAFAGELANLRGSNPEGKAYNMFGTASQPIPAQARMSDSATAPACSGTNRPALARPSNMTLTNTPDEILFARWAHPVKPTVRLCYTANFTNVEVAEDYKWTRTFADLSIRFEVQVNWNGWVVPFRSWENVWPLGEVCRRYVSGAPGGYCNNERYYLDRNWTGSYLPTFQNSVPEQTAWNMRDWVRDRANEWLSGRQKSYYDSVVSALNTVGSPLHHHNARLAKVTRLLQAYTQLGWARALDRDELLSLQTFGPERLPADWADMPVMASSFARAQANYGSCVLGSGRWPVAGACGEGQRDYNPLAQQIHIPANCAPGNPQGASGDPVGDCIIALTHGRLTALAARYEQHSRELAGGVYTEGMPDVQAVLDELSLADTFVRRT